MTRAMTWGLIFVGDTVRGADGRTWTVCERHAGPRWVIAGETARFVLRLGERAVSVARRHDEPVAVVQAANHRAQAAAVGALTDAGLVIEVLEETTVIHPIPAPDSAAFIPANSTPPQATATSAVRAAEPRFDNYGRYLLPDPQTGKERAWTRVTTVARTLADEWALGLWKQRMVAKGLALRPDLIASAAAADPDADKSTLNSIAEQAMDRAGAAVGRNMGTAFHTFAQRLDGGEPLTALGAPAPLDADLAAYLAMLRAARLEVVPDLMERIVILPELGVAGTLDRIVMRGQGDLRELSIMDLKSGKTVQFGWLEYAIQQAMYAHATHMWNPTTGGYAPALAVNQDRALIAHVPIGKAKAQLYGVNILEGWRLAQVAIQVREARAAASAGKWSWLVEPDDSAALALHNVSRATSREELARLWDRLHPAGLWTDEVNAAANARYHQLAEVQS